MYVHWFAFDFDVERQSKFLISEEYISTSWRTKLLNKYFFDSRHPKIFSKYAPVVYEFFNFHYMFMPLLYMLMSFFKRKKKTIVNSLQDQSSIITCR